MKIFIIVLLGFFWLNDCLAQDSMPFSTHPTKLMGKKAPGFTARQLNGEEFDLEKQLGKVIILNFWSLSCAVCFKEIPELNRLVDEFNKDIVVVSVMDNSVEQVYKQVSVQDGLYQLKKKVYGNDAINYVVIPSGKTIMQLYGLELSFPHNFVIDRKGRVQLFSSGYMQLFGDEGPIEDANFKNLRAAVLRELATPLR